MSWFSNPIKAVTGIARIATGDFSGVIDETEEVATGNTNNAKDNAESGSLLSGFGDSIGNFFVRGSLVLLALVFIYVAASMLKDGGE